MKMAFLVLNVVCLFFSVESFAKKSAKRTPAAGPSANAPRLPQIDACNPVMTGEIRDLAIHASKKQYIVLPPGPSTLGGPAPAPQASPTPPVPVPSVQNCAFQPGSNGRGLHCAATDSTVVITCEATVGGVTDIVSIDPQPTTWSATILRGE